ncbi:MAG TPA: hypothetical protein V6D17_03950 [Candidatus Obscuribacterales bacterium]
MSDIYSPYQNDGAPLLPLLGAAQQPNLDADNADCYLESSVQMVMFTPEFQ